MCDACIPISWYHLIISPGNQINLHLSSDPEKPWINRNVIFYAFHLSIICLPRNNWKKKPFNSFISDLMLLSRKPVFIYFLNSWFFVGYKRWSWLVIMSCQSASQQTRKLKLLTSAHSTLVAMQEKEFRQFSVYWLRRLVNVQYSAVVRFLWLGKEICYRI